MKRLLRLGLCLGVLAAALTCTALAAENNSTPGFTTANEGCTVTYEETEQKYTAAYAGTTVGNQYALLVVKQDDGGGYSIREDTIMYIDQQEATVDGVSFTFIPRSTPDCVVLLGGDFGEDGPSSPVTLGTLEGKGVTVSGSVTSYNPGNPVMLKLYKAGTEEVVAETTIAAQTGNGKVTQDFTLNSVPVGDSYDLEINKAGHTTYRLTGIPVEEDMALSALKLLSGDVNGDDKINVSDQNAILGNGTYNLSVSEAAVKLADVNGDDKVNVSDINVVLSSDYYNKGAIEITYSKGD